MRTPSGLSSSERTSHYCKYNAEERISLSAGHIKNKSSDSNTLLCPSNQLCFFYFVFIKVPHTTKPSFRLIPTQLRSSPSLPPFEVRAPIFHCRPPVRPSLQLSRHTALRRIYQAVLEILSSQVALVDRSRRPEKTKGGECVLSLVPSNSSLFAR